MLQTQNQVQKLNQRFPSSNTFPKRGKQSSPKLQNLVFFSELNILANKKTLLYHPASLVLLQFFLKQGHPFLAVIGMGWHSTNFPN
jgi:hypothetical protein